MKDIIDRYDEDTKFPGLLEVYFFLVLIVDLIFAVWMAFNAPVHIENFPGLRPLYTILIPVAFALPIVTAIMTRKARKALLMISNVYLSLRVFYLIFFYAIDMRLEIQHNPEEYGSAVSAGISVIAFIILFSAFWLFVLHRSEKVRCHIKGS